MRTITVVFALALLALLAYFVMPSDREPTPAADVVIPEPIATTVSQTLPEVDEEKSIVEVSTTVDEDCLTIRQLQAHPAFAGEGARLMPLMITGPSVSGYRGLNVSELRDLADQGDSAAMAVLGAAALLRARKLPEGHAVAYLMLEDIRLKNTFIDIQDNPDAVTDLREAASWFYRSALHGRLMALQEVGDAMVRGKADPVALRWIDREGYNALTMDEKRRLNPQYAFQQLIVRIAPEISTGPLEGNLMMMQDSAEIDDTLLDELAAKFVRDQEAAGLPPIEVAPSNAPSMAEIRDMICESEFPRED